MKIDKLTKIFWIICILLAIGFIIYGVLSYKTNADIETKQIQTIPNEGWQVSCGDENQGMNMWNNETLSNETEQLLKNIYPNCTLTKYFNKEE
jgi:hypothetical protein